jgi:FixJ family two-component response regulator
MFPIVATDQRPLILLIEDDDAVRRALHFLLSANGYGVHSFPGAAGVANEVGGLGASCLVADLLVPDGDGLSLLQEMRSAGWSGPAILISGHLTDELVARALNQGYALVLPKPIGESVLVSAIGRLLEDDVAPGAPG